MGIAMSDADIWQMLAAADKGVFVSLRESGTPVALPVWFVVHEQLIYLRTPARSKKIARITADDRVAFLVDDGRAWAELRGIHVSGTAQVLDDPQLSETVAALIDAKYAGLRSAPSQRPAATNQHYADRQIVRITPDHILSWDNRLLRREATR
jgi:nitroimidazol reductase NimA-like FMN-containing flavoprotein (pyridoxamine 5'-phosphate oxidase superfamily)